MSERALKLKLEQKALNPGNLNPFTENPKLPTQEEQVDDMPADEAIVSSAWPLNPKP